MTAQDQLTLRVLLIHNDTIDSNSHSAYRLLSELGHDVSATASTEQAVERLQDEHADLVIIDSDRPSQQAFIDRVTHLPADQQPRQVAIFCDVQDDTVRALAQQLQRSRVNLLLKPLHMHGLLNVLRSIESKV